MNIYAALFSLIASLQITTYCFCTHATETTQETSTASVEDLCTRKNTTQETQYTGPTNRFGTSYEVEISQGNTHLKKLCDTIQTIHKPTSHTYIVENALHLAVGINDHTSIKQLLQQKKFYIDNSRVGYSLATPLHTAIQHFAVSKDSGDQQERYLTTIKLLLKLGAQPEEKNYWGECAYTYAQRKGVEKELRDILVQKKIEKI